MNTFLQLANQVDKAWYLQQGVRSATKIVEEEIENLAPSDTCRLIVDGGVCVSPLTIQSRYGLSGYSVTWEALFREILRDMLITHLKLDEREILSDF